MRIQAAGAIRVGPGDEIVIRGQLPAAAKLGRLYVFASANGGPFAPYVQGENELLVVNGRPTMSRPMYLRLHAERPARVLAFTADFYGYICVMQEVDTADDPRVKVRVQCKLNPDLGWKEWIWRKILQWKPPRLTS